MIDSYSAPIILAHAYEYIEHRRGGEFDTLDVLARAARDVFDASNAEYSS